MMFQILTLLLCVVKVNSYYFIENFENKEFMQRWVQSSHAKYTFGLFNWTTGTYYFDAIKHKGIRTTKGDKYYAYSVRLKKTFDSKDRPFVFQFQLQTETAETCSGGYIKVLPEDFDEFHFGRKSDYYVMFGPDSCNIKGKKVMVSLYYQGQYYDILKEIESPDDTLTHLYTLIFYTNNTVRVKIDNLEVYRDSFANTWKLTVDEFIDDPNAVKPADWDERETIPISSEDDDIENDNDDDDDKNLVPDESVKKPEDWQDEFDGKWEPPLIPDPHNKRKMSLNMMPNPNYSGIWYPPVIKNPHYREIKYGYDFPKVGGLGIEVWQVKAGSLFDNIILTSDESLAEKSAREQWFPLYEHEKRQIALHNKTVAAAAEVESHDEL